MNEFVEQTVTALRTLFGKVHILQQITIQDILKPETYQLYEECLQEAYDALVQVEPTFRSRSRRDCEFLIAWG